MDYYKIKWELKQITKNGLFRYGVVFFLGFVTSSYIGITKKEMTDMLTNLGWSIAFIVFGVIVLVAIIKMPQPRPRNDDVEIIRTRRD